jgi:cytochrome bd-type quinol oxidase subunit 2
LNGRLTDPRVSLKASEDLNYERMCSCARKLSIVVVVVVIVVVIVVVVVVRCKPTLEWRKLIVTVRLSSVKFHANLFTVFELLHANRWTDIHRERGLFIHILCLATDP